MSGRSSQGKYVKLLRDEASMVRDIVEQEADDLGEDPSLNYRPWIKARIELMRRVVEKLKETFGDSE